MRIPEGFSNLSQKKRHKQTVKITLEESLVNIDIFCSKNKSDIASMGIENCLRNVLDGCKWFVRFGVPTNHLPNYNYDFQ